MPVHPNTIVPANRLGQLLAEARLASGIDLAELSRRSGGDFTVGELSDVEAGHRLLDEDLIREITSLYAVDCGPIIPQRAELTIDLDANLVSAAGRAVPLASDARNHIIDRYLSLVYVLRNRPPGTRVDLRGEDLAILAASLAEREELIEEQLLLLMGSGGEPVAGLVRWFRSRLWVPGAGALVGAVSVGTLVMVASDALGVRANTTVTQDLQTDRLARDPQGTALLVPSTSSIPMSPRISTPAITPPGDTAPTGPISTGARELGARAEALLPFDWQSALPGWTIVYRPANADFRGLTFPYDRSIEMYVREDDTPELVAGILAHELGHAIDVSILSDDERAEWLEARGLEGAPWWPNAFASDFETGAGDFAEAFALWAVDDPSSARLAESPTAEQLQLLERLVADHL